MPCKIKVLAEIYPFLLVSGSRLDWRWWWHWRRRISECRISLCFALSAMIDWKNYARGFPKSFRILDDCHFSKLLLRFAYFARLGLSKHTETSLRKYTFVYETAPSCSSQWLVNYTAICCRITVFINWIVGCLLYVSRTDRSRLTSNVSEIFNISFVYI